MTYCQLLLSNCSSHGLVFSYYVGVRGSTLKCLPQSAAFFFLTFLCRVIIC